MPRLETGAALVAGLVALVHAGSVHALERLATDSGATAAAVAPEAPGPSGSEEEDLPEGHPAVENSNPHAHPGKASGMPGVFDPPEDLEQEDPTLAPGTIAVDLRDPEDKPVAGEMITLGVLLNSIAKGDSRKHIQATSDAQGHVVFSGLETASNIAYRVSSGYQGGSFAASPFQLQQVHSMHVVLHVYPVARDLSRALIVCEATIAAELRDDRIQIEEALIVYNLGRTAWQPDDARMALPDGFTAFNSQASMSDQGVDETGGAAKLRGTFAPGRHSVQFRWQLPWSGDKDVDFDVGLPPHVAIARVMMPALSTIKLTATDFPPPEVRRDEQGQSFLVTERRLQPNDPKLSVLSIGIHDLPTPGAGPHIATFLAVCGVGTGLAFAAFGRRRQREPGEKEGASLREALLDELAGLERAHKAGRVGPRTYERARRELIDALAHTLIDLPSSGREAMRA